MIAHVIHELLKGFVSDLARGHVNDAGQTRLVRWIEYQTEVRENVLDFLSFVKFHSAVHTIRDVFSDERFFDQSGLSVRTIQDGPILVVIHPVIDDGRDFTSFLLFVGSFYFDDLFSLLIGSPKRFVERFAVVLDHAVRSLDHGLGRSVVFFEFYDKGIGIILFEMENVLDVRSSPAVNPLPVVTYDRKIPVLLGEKLNDTILDLVRILVLIDHDIRETIVKIRKNFWNGKNLVRFQKNVVEIERVLLPHAFFVLTVHSCYEGFRIIVSASMKLLGGMPFVFRTGNHSDYLSRGRFLLIDLQIRKNGFYKSDLVVLVVYNEAFGVPDPVNEQTQKIHPDRVERADHRNAGRTVRIDAGRRNSELTAHSFSHFFGRFVRKGDAKDLIRWDSHVFHHMENALRERMGLPCPSTGKDKHRSVYVVYGFLLFGVEHDLIAIFLLESILKNDEIRAKAAYRSEPYDRYGERGT